MKAAERLRPRLGRRLRLRPCLRLVVVAPVVVALLVATGCYPAVSDDAPYVGVVYQADDVTLVEGVSYGSGIDDTGADVDLQLDLFLPPLDGRARPTIVLLHGGGYLFGARTDFHDEARQWAQRGWVAVTPSYRLASSVPPDGFADTGPALDASADGQLVNKWLRANAASYDIDPERLAVVGSSAGGVIALMTAQSTDLTGDRHDGPESHVANAVISTGGPIVPLLAEERLTAQTVAAPALVHHFEVDDVTGYVGDDARFTCLVWGSEPSTSRCTPVISEGSDHTVGIGPVDALSLNDYHPFLTAELDLANAAAP
jgi:dienelactone hydrolase